jgi:hypothetical protein
MMKAEPQKEHQWLRKLLGEWTFIGGSVRREESKG